jgi:hypothetical protein
VGESLVFDSESESLFEHHGEVKLGELRRALLKSIAARNLLFKYNEFDSARDPMLQPVRE